MKEINDIKFVILCVLDGWGIAPPGPGNATTLANTPNLSRLRISYPHTQLEASGEAVGLPPTEVGNTETGHLNLGAGKIVYQDLARINMSIADGSFFTNHMILGAIDHAKRNNSSLHLMGLVSGGVVHSSLEHLFAIIETCRQQNFSKVFIHCFTDGRDSPPTVAKSYIKKLQEVCQKAKVGTVASIIGRYWAMDRDRRWERTQKAYFCLTKGQGHLVKTIDEAIDMSYQAGVTDEFIEPSIISSQTGQPISLISPNDAVIFFNFRIDRPRQLAKAFVLDDFSAANLESDIDAHASKKLTPSPLFDRGEKLKNLYFVTMTEYSQIINQAGAHVAFPPELVNIPLGRVIADHELRQLRVAESEKERFVGFYFNGQQDVVYPAEEHMIIPSPKVPTYDKQPEMSAIPMTDALIHKITQNNSYSFVLINYANPDMVGHTGNLQAAIKACEVVDQCVGKLASFVSAYGGALLITADHGNVEKMLSEHNSVDTEHNNSPVPFIAVSKRFESKGITLPSGILADVAPTVISLLGLEVPTAMMGRDLLASVKI